MFREKKAKESNEEKKAKQIGNETNNSCKFFLVEAKREDKGSTHWVFGVLCNFPVMLSHGNYFAR